MRAVGFIPTESSTRRCQGLNLVDMNIRDDLKAIAHQNRGSARSNRYRIWVADFVNRAIAQPQQNGLKRLRFDGCLDVVWIHNISLSGCKHTVMKHPQLYPIHLRQILALETVQAYTI
jgi:hypothetical protein